MGLFQRLVNKTSAGPSAPAGDVEQVTLSQLIDLLDMGGVPRNKLSEVTYFTCLRVLSEGISKLPLKLIRSTPERGVEELRQDPLYQVLRYRPNPLQSATYFWADMEMSRNHYGNAYAAIFGSGADTQLWHMRSDRVSVWFDDRHILGKDSRVWYIWSAPDGKRYKLCQDEVLHFRTWLSLDGITGLSVQDILRGALDGTMQSQQMLNSLYKNGFTAKAAVQYTGDLNSEAEQNFLRGLEAYATGQMDATKSFIPVPLGSRIEPLNIKLTDSQFIEIRRHSALQIAAAFGVKPNQINDYEKSSFASSEAQQLAFLTDTLLWILKGYEEELSWKLLEPRQLREGTAAQFNTAVLLRADTRTQIESMTEAVANSIYMPNEARAYLGMAAAPGGDRLIANGNVIPLEDVGIQYGKE